MSNAISVIQSSPTFPIFAAASNKDAVGVKASEGKGLNAAFEAKAAALPNATPRSIVMVGAPDLRPPVLSLDAAANQQVSDALNTLVQFPKSELESFFHSDKMRGVPMDSDLLLALIVQLKALQLEQSASERNLGGKLTALSFDGSKATADSHRLSGNAAIGTAISSAFVGIGFAGLSLRDGVKAHQMQKNSLVQNEQLAANKTLHMQKRQARFDESVNATPEAKRDLARKNASTAKAVADLKQAHSLEVSRSTKLSTRAHILGTLPVAGVVDGAGQTVQKNEDAIRTMGDASVNVVNQASKNTDDVGNASLDLAKQLQAMMRDHIQSKRDTYAAVASKVA